VIPRASRCRLLASSSWTRSRLRKASAEFQARSRTPSGPTRSGVVRLRSCALRPHAPPLSERPGAAHHRRQPGTGRSRCRLRNRHCGAAVPVRGLPGARGRGRRAHGRVPAGHRPGGGGGQVRGLDPCSRRQRPTRSPRFISGCCPTPSLPGEPAAGLAPTRHSSPRRRTACGNPVRSERPSNGGSTGSSPIRESRAGPGAHLGRTQSVCAGELQEPLDGIGAAIDDIGGTVLVRYATVVVTAVF
jgi:hypothetical protein